MSHCASFHNNFVVAVNPQTKQEAIELATGIAESVTDKSPGDVGLFVPFPFIETVQKIAGDKFVVGAEVRPVTLTFRRLLHPLCLTLLPLNPIGHHPRSRWCFHRRNLACHAEEYGHHVGLGWSLGTSYYQ